MSAAPGAPERSRGIVSLEMSVSHADFFRLLADAIGGVPWEAEGDIIRINHPGGRVLIRLSPERTRRIASMSFPVTDVTLAFEDFSPQAVERFMARFHLYYRRGGG